VAEDVALVVLAEFGSLAEGRKGLAGALQKRLDAVEVRGGMKVDLQVEGSEALSPGPRQELYQLAQEALNNALKHAREAAYSVTILDTAGRLHIDDEMMAELEAVKQATHPHEILLVADAMTGQDAGFTLEKRVETLTTSRPLSAVHLFADAMVTFRSPKPLKARP
jgi:hypothetical protein